MHTEPPRQSLVWYIHVSTFLCAHTHTHAWINVTQHPPYIPCSPEVAHPPFIIQSFLILCHFPRSLFSPPLLHVPNPLSHHYFSQHMGVGETHSSLALSLIPEWIVSLPLTLMNHSLPPRSPIISDGIAPMPLMFTNLTIHCQDCAAGYDMAVTHLAELRV